VFQALPAPTDDEVAEVLGQLQANEELFVCSESGDLDESRLPWKPTGEKAVSCRWSIWCRDTQFLHGSTGCVLQRYCRNRSGLLSPGLSLTPRDKPQLAAT
jgi:hypothetical protein